MKQCIKQGCDSTNILARGYCSTHYKTEYWFKRKPLYVTWEGMIRRCSDENSEKYPHYGGRGITVCERWSGKNGYNNFVKDMWPKPAGLTLDRIDNDGNYEPSNCRWATSLEQRHNQRRQKVRKDSPLGEPGIRLRPGGLKYEARGTNGVHIGDYETIEEAIIARGQWYAAKLESGEVKEAVY